MSSNSSFTSNNLDSYCSTSKSSKFILIGIWSVKSILILPLSTFILHMAYQRWRQRRSFSTSSHSDVFTYHLAAMEMFWGFGMLCYICGLYSNNFVVIMIGMSALSFTIFGELLFNLLTCIERYLAVLHPITYRGLKNARGVRIRNISIGCVWLLTFGLIGVQLDYTNDVVMISTFSLLCFILVVISYCTLSVLFVLIRPGPGEGGRDKDRVDQSKQKAFYTITAISSVLWLWFVGLLIVNSLRESTLLDKTVSCLLASSIGFLNFPSSLVSPLLYLHRAEKLVCFCCNHEYRQD